MTIPIFKLVSLENYLSDALSVKEDLVMKNDRIIQELIQENKLFFD
jgi:hypothetical protein